MPDAPMRFFACIRLSRRAQMSAPRKMLVTAMTKKSRGSAATIRSLLGACVLAILLSGCAGVYYVDTNHTPESGYNTYYGPDYYPYYPWYAYYGGAYY